MPCPKEIRLNNLIAPTFQVLRQLDGACDIDSIIDALGEKLSLSDEIVDLLHKGSNSQTELEYQLAWIKTYFKKLGYIIPDGKLWVLTPKTKELDENAVAEQVRAQRKLDHKIALEKRRNKKNEDSNESIQEDEPLESEDFREDDVLDWKSRLSKVLQNMNPYAFERLSKRLIQECGFTHVVVTKKSGDGGIDGYGKIKINGVFSINIAFQCKRYSGSVPTSDIRDFRGSLTTDIEKGIFITTGKFSSEAQKEACDKGKKQIDLIDGDEFMEKIAVYKIGVKPVTTYEIDEQFFENI